MGQIRLTGNPPIEVNLRRSARARRLSLRISQLDGRVTLTLPDAVPEAQGVAFLREKEDWLRGHLARQPGSVTIRAGARLPVEGALHEIRPGQGRSVRQADGVLWVPGPEARIAARLKGWLRARARDRLSEACDLYAGRLGRGYDRLTLRDTRSRWGSCTHDGGLMFSWRLILADPRVLDYVAAHEVAHLRHMNHSAAFWDQVRALYGDWQPSRNWLRAHGHELHRYRFDAG
ncbi:M48 family metallopeptidase [Pseudoponticoccus marisrubri]|uniref:Zinc metalloprotease n=1 Tax=Pseudoponticoccus marisrubri TaxID=1685382 RepID=A0A0W7WI21_9RHOB|nr:SprT family zinc-dependent metalloprotease [Pseudoponticoccus marisrubri]KUF10261.1 zinc metalloprotease [Pseudoponticoccus marisrubri]